MRKRHRAVLLTVAALLFASPPTTAGGSGEISATPPADGPCDHSGPPERYLVVFDHDTTNDAASDEVETACGELTTYHPEIAVGVATSGDLRFAGRQGGHRTFAIREPHATSPAPPSGGQAEGAATHSLTAGDLTDRQWNLRAIGAPATAESSPGSEPVVVGVLDSGIDTTHPDLADAVDPDLSVSCLSGTPERPASPAESLTSPHGTHVAGVIAAQADGHGVTGIAPGSKLASVTVVDAHGRVSPGAAICGLLWAAEHDFTVANGSFLVAPWAGSCAREPGGAVVRRALGRALDHARDEGTLPVVAASNSGTELTPADSAGPDHGRHRCEALPAALRGAVSVSASDREGRKAGYSAYGIGVIDLTAPGGDRGDCVLSTVPGGYGTLCGTSMAAPHVTGVAALVASQRPGLTAEQLQQVLIGSAAPVPCPEDYDLTGDGTQNAYCEGYAGFNGFYGHGRVDAAGAAHTPPSSSPTQRGDPAGDPEHAHGG